MKYKYLSINAIIVVIIYASMFFEYKYNILFPYGTLSGRTLVAIFLPVTIYGFTVVIFTFRAALRSDKEKRFQNFILLLFLSTLWSSISFYFLSTNSLNFHQSIANELKENIDPQYPTSEGRFLNKRGLSKLPAQIFQHEFKVIVATDNQINYISSEIGSSSLLELQLDRNKLSSLPNELSLSHIKSLSLSRNKFVTFPEDFRFPASLKKLFLDHNRLTSLSNALENSTSLEYLGLWGNKLSQLPESMDNLSKLKTLSLHRNNFTEFPSVILKLKKLTWLALPYNQIKSLPPELANMTNLQTLHLNGNPIPQEQVDDLRKKMPFCNITFEN